MLRILSFYALRDELLGCISLKGFFIGGSTKVVFFFFFFFNLGFLQLLKPYIL